MMIIVPQKGAGSTALEVRGQSVPARLRCRLGLLPCSPLLLPSYGLEAGVMAADD